MNPTEISREIDLNIAPPELHPIFDPGMEPATATQLADVIARLELGHVLVLIDQSALIVKPENVSRLPCQVNVGDVRVAAGLRGLTIQTKPGLHGHTQVMLDGVEKLTPVARLTLQVTLDFIRDHTDYFKSLVNLRQRRVDALNAAKTRVLRVAQLHGFDDLRTQFFFLDVDDFSAINKSHFAAISDPSATAFMSIYRPDPQTGPRRARSLLFTFTNDEMTEFAAEVFLFVPRAQPLSMEHGMHPQRFESHVKKYDHRHIPAALLALLD
jgi:hypothetical protein